MKADSGSIGEESVAAGEKEELTDEFTWIVDPIDVRTSICVVLELS